MNATKTQREMLNKIHFLIPNVYWQLSFHIKLSQTFKFSHLIYSSLAQSPRTASKHIVIIRLLSSHLNQYRGEIPMLYLLWYGFKLTNILRIILIISHWPDTILELCFNFISSQSLMSLANKKDLKHLPFCSDTMRKLSRVRMCKGRLTGGRREHLY